MSPHCGSLCLLVLLGAVGASGLPCQFVSKDLSQIYDSVADVLELKKAEIGSKPLFNSIIKGINTSCQQSRKEQVRLMNATLDVYMHIFSSILQNSRDPQTPHLLDQVPVANRPTVSSVLVKLQQKMLELKRHLSSQIHNREDMFDKLSKIEVDDPREQRKALAQFKEIYQAAAEIGSRHCGSSHGS